MSASSITIDTLMDCFVSRRVENKACLEILEYFYGDELEKAMGVYALRNVRVLFTSISMTEKDSARLNLNKLIQIQE